MLSLKVKYVMVPQVIRHVMWISSYFAYNIDHPCRKPIIIYDENQHCIYTLKNQHVMFAQNIFKLIII